MIVTVFMVDVYLQESHRILSWEAMHTIGSSSPLSLCIFPSSTKLYRLRKVIKELIEGIIITNHVLLNEDFGNS